jgi:hypothetical protein
MNKNDERTKDNSELDNSELLTQQDNVETASKKTAGEDKHEEDRSTPEEITQELVNIKTSAISKMLLDLNKISQKAFNTDVNIALYQGTPTKIAMERRGSNREINTLVAINFDSDGMTEKGLTISGTKKLTQFDRIILDAVNSLVIEGHNQFITTQMIFHVITGDINRRITPNYAQEINNSLTKLLFSHITIKANEEAVMYPQLKDFEYHDTIIPGRMVKAILNGTEVACIQVDREPPLYLYAKYKNQISQIDLSLIKLPFAGEKQENKEQMTLLYYLLRRIIALKSISNVIKYETIYHELGKDDSTRKVKFLIRESTKRILDSWKGSIFGDIEFTNYTEKILGKTPYEIILEYKIITQED